MGCTPYNTIALHIWSKGSSGSIGRNVFTVAWADPAGYVWGKPKEGAMMPCKGKGRRSKGKKRGSGRKGHKGGGGGKKNR